MKQLSGKTVLLLLAVIAIGMYAIPNTLAMYSEQPQLISVKGDDNSDCEYCHGSSVAIYDELNKSSVSHSGYSCRGCHGFMNYSSIANDNSLGHAATTEVACIDCHAETPEYINRADGANNTIIVNGLNRGTGANGYKHSQNGNYSAPNPNVKQDGICINCHTKVVMYNRRDAPEEVNNQILINLSDWSYGSSHVRHES